MSTIGNFLTSALTYILAISLLVAVHEFGHFWVARRLGIKTLRYSIGFGRVLWSRYGKDGTEYAVSAIPLGGYVRMLDERDSQVAEIDLPRAFNRQPVWKRVAVLFAGPAFNFLFAVVAYWVLFVAGVPGLTPVVGTVESGSLAASAGLRADDRIVSVAGRQTPTREAALEGILDALLNDGVVNMHVVGTDRSERDVTLYAEGRSRELTEPNALFDGLGFDFWTPKSPPVLGAVSSDGAAAQAGLQAGDRILKFDGVEIASFEQLAGIIAELPGKTVQVEYEHDGVASTMSVQLGTAEVSGRRIGVLGVSWTRAPFPESMQVVQQDPPFAALGKAFTETGAKIAFTFKIVWKLIVGEVSVRSISGPIGIAAVAGAAVHYGFTVFVSLLAVISISVGALNLLPVPILDGGQIVYQLAELLKGGPVSERAQLLGQQVGIVLLVLLMGLALFNDLAPHLS